MTLKRIYNLKNQKITQYHDDLPKTCVCVLLILFVICGLILAAVFIVKNGQSVAEDRHGQLNQDSGNSETFQSNKKSSIHPNTKNDFFVTSAEGNLVTRSSTAEYTSTTSEPTKDVPPRFLIVNTVSAVESSSSDYSTAGSSNHYVKLTGSEIDTSSAVKRSTITDVINAETNSLDDDYIDAYLQLSNEGPMRSTLINDNSTPKYGLEMQDDQLNQDSETLQPIIIHPNTKNDLAVTSAEGNTVTTSNTAEYTSTTIESPLSTSTMSPPKYVPFRFSIVNTVTSEQTSSSDYLTADPTNGYGKITGSGIDTSSTVKWTTVTNVITSEASTLDDDYIDAYLQLSNEEPTRSTLINENSTPKYGLEMQDEHQTCTTNSCKQSASKMLALVNHMAEPCDDFYSYACGGFVINHFEEFTVNDRVLQTLPDISTLDVTVPYKKLYRDFFVSCTNYKNGRGLREVAKLLYDLCVDHKDSLTDLIADIIMLYPQKTLSRLLPLFDVVMEVGPEKKLIPTVSLPTFNSLLAEDVDKDLYERSCRKLTEMETALEKNKTVVQETYKECIGKEYYKSLEESIFLLQIFGHLPDYNSKKLAITNIIKFIKENIIDNFGSISDDELRNAKRETVAINWLNSAYPAIEWNKLFERLFGTEVAKNITEVQMTHFTYLVKILKFYETHTFEDIKSSILSMMSVDLNLDFIEPLSATDHYKYCSTTATKLMPDIASMLYLETFSPSDILQAEQKLKLMFDQLVLTFNATLNENIWVNEKVRNEVSMKISELNLVTNPYQGFVRFKEYYNKLYSAVSISTKDYISNVIALKQVAKRRMYNTIGESAISPEIIWNHLVWPISSSPVRITETTTIVLPTSLIAPFTSESQKIEEFSTIGFLVAQEISRFLYIDKTSKLFVNENEDFKANMETHLLDPAYSKNPNIYGIHLNHEDINASQRSRFVDDVALRVTFDAYDQYQSPFDKLMPWTDNSISKIFYLLTSQQFCTAKGSSVGVAIDLIRNENLPNYFRINSMMMNSESFLNAFECQLGT